MNSRQGTSAGRETRALKDGWKFKLADAPEMAGNDYDDAGWQAVRVPHDWAIAGPFARGNDIEPATVTRDGRETVVERTGVTGGLPHVGRAWYRLRFELPADIGAKRTRVEFDGIMSHSVVYCNGRRVGNWPYGYSSFAFDLSGFVRPGGNLLAVSVDNKPLASRWYPGAGIYRNVRLVTTAPVHVAHWGTFITTPSVSADGAEIEVRTEVENHAGGRCAVELETTVFSPDGEPVATAADSRGVSAAGVFRQALRVAAPALWSPAMPRLYRARSVLRVAGTVCDSCETVFGIRSLGFDAREGFLLNGERVRLNGVCLHHDLGPLGSAVNAAALARQLSMLRDMGANAIRTSHNPPAPELLDLADRLGFLVVDEAFDEWRRPKCANGYHTLFDRWAEKDLCAMIRRDRNHPSVIMWSIGNEIPEQQDRENGAATARFLHEVCRREDPTRSTTSAFSVPDAAIANGLAQVVDVPGWNYQPHAYGLYRARLPLKPVYGSETSSCVSSRGEYYFPVDEEKDPRRETLQVSSYDLSSPFWASLPDTEFRGVDEHPFIMGEFVWTGFDYLGEPAPYFEEWPARSSYFGIIDLCGLPKDRFYLYQSRWASRETLHLLPHWTWPGREGQVTPVHCYTSWDRVELFVNGVSAGMRVKHPKNLLNRYRLTWNGVIYQPGELRAVAYDAGGRPAKETVVRTAGAPARVQLAPERPGLAADGEDMAFVRVEISDRQGCLCPRADNMVRFRVDGPAEIAAVDNGNPASIEPFQADFRKAFNGRCMLYLRSVRGCPGPVTVRAESPGLAGAEITIPAE